MLSPGSRSLRGSPQHRQRGMFLLEALVGILIFSIGILALVAMQATAITAQADAQYRVEAANRPDGGAAFTITLPLTEPPAVEKT